MLTREPRRLQMCRRSLRRLPLRELGRLPTLWSLPRQTNQGHMEAAKEGAEMAGDAWETVKEKSTRGTKEAEDA